MRYILSFILCVMSLLLASAQFRLVDAENGLPIAGAYVFSSTNKLLCMSDANGIVKKFDGQVTISNLAYEPKTVDGCVTGDIKLTPKSIELPEVIVQKSEYKKVTGAFRDIFRNNGKTVLYREGIMEYYIDIKTGKMKRVVRACRQYEHPKLRKPFSNVILLDGGRSTDLSRIRLIETDSTNVVTKGDTTIYGSHYKDRAVDNAIMTIDTHRKNLERCIIDKTKFMKKTESFTFGVGYRIKDDINDWTFSIDEEGNRKMLSLRRFCSCDWIENSKKDTIYCEELRDFVVTDVSFMTKKQAKEEMNDKTEISDFPHPDSLPDIPYDVERETQGLEKKSFWER